MPSPTARRWNVALLAAALLLWAAALGGVTARVAHRPQKNTVVGTYLRAGERWLEQKPLYKGRRGFVYSPAVAAAFAPLTVVPPLPAHACWRLLNATVFLGGVAWWLRLRLFAGVSPQWTPALLLLLLPLALGNLNNGQVNPLLAGLLLIAAAACHRGRYFLAGACLAVATLLKIYPLAMALLLIVAYPKLAPRFLLALFGLVALSLLLQEPGYALKQYQLWVQTRLADNRLAYADSIAPRDLWVLLRLARVPFPPELYPVLQAGSGVAIAILVFGWRKRGDCLPLLFCLGSVWMLLCGPATESATYILLAAPAVLALAEAYGRPLPRVARVWTAAVLVILLAALGMNSFLKLRKTVWTLSVQPAAALLFGGYILYRARLGADKSAEPARLSDRSAAAHSS